MSGLKRKIFVICISVFMVAALSVGIVFAYYQWNHRFAHSISTGTKVTFLLDGEAYGENVRLKEGQLVRGQAMDLNVDVELRAHDTSKLVLADYEVKISAEGELAPAIEVYRLQDGVYEYICQLSDWSKMDTLSGYLTLQKTRRYSYRLRYSDGAGEYYDGKTFSLTATASSKLISTKEAKEIAFVSTEKELTDAVSDGKKEIVLVKDKIALTNPLSLPSDVTLDLNGYTLTGNITVTDGTENMVGGLTNGTLIGGVTVNCPNGLFKVSAVTETVTVTNFDFDKLVQAISDNAAKYSRVRYADGEEVPLAAGLSCYLKDLNAVYLGSNSCLKYESGKFSVTYSAAANTETEYRLTIATGTQSKVIKGILNVQGQSAKAYAESLLGKYGYNTTDGKAKVSSNVFFPVRGGNDCTFTWISSNPAVLDENGVIARGGYSSLDTWATKDVEMTLICAYNGQQYKVPVSFTVEILSVEERTDVCFVCGDIVVDGQGEQDSVTSVYEQIKSETLATVDKDKDKTKLQNVTLALSEKDGFAVSPSDYLSVANDENGYPVVTLKNQNPSSKAIEFNYTLTFTYADGTTTRTGNVILTGKNQSDAAYDDPTTTLQEKLQIIDYKDEHVLFDVLGAYKGAYVYYELAPQNEQTGVPAGYDAASYVFINNASYEFIDNAVSETVPAQIRVLQSKVPAVNSKVKINAYLIDYENVTVNTDGTVTVKKTDAPAYTLTLDVEGILHNTAQEIDNKLLFNYVLAHCDKNGDGWLTLSEAAAYTGTISLPSQKIASLKGVEYFKNLTALDVSGNEIIDLSYLSQLYELKSLNLKNNKITDIEALQYLDNLTELNLSNNTIGNIEPIRALTGIQKLDISHNDDLSDFSALENYGSLTELKIYQTLSKYTDGSTSTMYYMSVLAANCPALNNNLYVQNAETKRTISDEEKAAARALYDLELYLEVHKTLWVPSEYDGYNLEWFALNNDDKIIFTNADGKVTGWAVVSPIVDTTVTLGVRIVNINGSITLSRPFDVKLLVSSDTQLKIEKTAGATPEPAIDVVTDGVLLAALNKEFNKDSDGLLSYAEITAAPTTSTFLLNGATSLKGVQYFTGLGETKTTFDLSNSVLENPDDIQYLVQAGVQELTLGAQAFDFTKLIIDGVYENGRLVYRDTYTTPLTTLDVSRCYNLSDEETLRQLLAVYLANDGLTIYVEEGKEWDPFKALDGYMQTLPSLYTFKTLHQVVNFFENNDSTKYVTFNADQGTVTVKLYDYYPVTYRVTELSYTHLGETQATNAHLSDDKIKFTYNALVAYDQTLYAVMTLKADIRRGNVSGEKTYKHVAQLQVDYNYDIYLQENGTRIPLQEAFPGRDLRAAVLGRLSADILQRGYVTVAELNALDVTSITINCSDYEDVGTAPNAIKGLHYLTRCTNLTIKRDASFGDCSDLVNIVTLNVQSSGVDFSRANVTKVNGLANIQTLNLTVRENENVAEVTVEVSHNFFVNWGNSFQYFLSLTSLSMLDCNHYDWDFLQDYNGPGLEKLEIYATRNNGVYHSYSNRYSHDIAASGWTFKLGKWKGKTLADMYNALGTPEYYIGEKGKVDYYNNQKTSYTPEDSNLDTNRAPDALSDYNLGVAGNFLLDLGVKVNGRLIGDGYTKIKAGSTIVLPQSTGNVLYTPYGEEQEYLTRDYAICWYAIGDNIFGMNNFKEVGALDIPHQVQEDGNCLNPIQNGKRGADITATLNNNGFLVLYGIIGGDPHPYSGWYDREGNFIKLPGCERFGWIYILEVADGQAAATGSYADQFKGIDDYALEYYLALHRRKAEIAGQAFNLENITYMEITDSGTEGGNRFPQCKIQFAGYNETIRFNPLGDGGLDALWHIKTRAPLVYSLKGLENCTNLQTFKVSSVGQETDHVVAAIHDITPLKDCTNLTEITVNGMGLTSAPDFSKLNNLQTLDLSYNNLTTLGALPNGVTSINLAHNPGLSASAIDVGLFNGDTLRAANLNTLSVYGTKDEGSQALLDVLTKLYNKNANVNVYYSNADIAINRNQLSTFTTNVQNFFNNKAGSINISDQNSTVNVKFNLATGGDPQKDTYNSTVTYDFDPSLDEGKIYDSNVYVKIDLNANKSLYAYYLVNVYNAGTEDTSFNVDGTTYTSRNFDGRVWSVYKNGFTGTFDQSNLSKVSLKNMNVLGYTSISLSNTSISEIWTGQYTALNSLTLSNCAITTEQLITILNTCPNLKTLDLSRCYGYEIDAALATRLAGMTTLKLNAGDMSYGGVYHNLNEAIDAILLGKFGTGGANSRSVTSFCMPSSNVVRNIAMTGGEWRIAYSNYYSMIRNGIAVCKDTYTNAVYTDNDFKFLSYGIGTWKIADFLSGEGTNTDPTGAMTNFLTNFLKNNGVSYLLVETEGNTGLNVYFPTDITYYGENYHLNYRFFVGNTTYAEITWNGTGYTINNGLLHIEYKENVGYYLCLRATDDLFANTDGSLTISYTVRLPYENGGNRLYKESSIYINDITGQRTQVPMRFFVETNAQGFVYNTDYYQNAYEHEQYYTDKNATNIIYCADAYEFFESGRVLNKIKEWERGQYVQRIYDRSGGAVGYVITLDVQQNLYSMQFYRNYITSLEGVQLFKNVKIIRINESALLDIEPLRTLALDTFEYNNTLDIDFADKYFYIRDFSPLYNGASEETLTTFIYSTAPTVDGNDAGDLREGIGNNRKSAQSFITDLSFLVKMSKLQSVYLFDDAFNNAYIGSWDGYKIGALSAYRYLFTPSFHYTVAKLYEQGAYVYVGQRLLDDTLKAGDGSLIKSYFDMWLPDYWNYDTYRPANAHGKQNNYYRLLPSEDWLKAAVRLSAYSASNVATNTSAYDGFVEISTASAISSVMNYAGEMYLVHWRSASSYLTVGGYHLTAAYGGYAAGQILTYEQAAALLSDNAFINEYNWGRIDIVCDVTLDECDQVYRLIGGIDMDEYRYERMFTVVSQ